MSIPNFIYPPKPTSSGITPLHPTFNVLAKLNKNYVVEEKKDGWAAIVTKINDEYFYFNRFNQPLQRNIIPMAKEIFETLDIPNGTMLGFEAIGLRTLKVKDKMSFYGVYFFNGKKTENLSYAENKELLKSLIKPVKDRIEVLDHFSLNECPNNSFKQFYTEKIVQEDTEGIVLKDVTKPIKTFRYESKKLPYWVKFKEQEEHKKRTR